MKFLKRLIGLFRDREPKLLDAYYVKEGDQILATLINPYCDDMFWWSFELLPQTQDEALLNTLYSGNFWWSDRRKFFEKDSGREVDFLLAARSDANGEEDHDYLEKRPERVVLRGPYGIKTPT